MKSTIHTQKPDAAMVAMCAAFLATATTTVATERTWVGESGASWYVAENYDPSGIPAETDTVVFRPDGELTVVMSGSQYNCRAGEIRFESGKTTFAIGSGFSAFYMGGSPTNILHVAECAEAVVSNKFFSTRVSGNARRFRKTGGGKFTIVPGGNEWWEHSTDRFAGCDFAEGETILDSNGGKTYPLKSIPIHVCSGAVVRCGGSTLLRKGQNIEIDRGGLLDCGVSFDKKEEV